MVHIAKLDAAQANVPVGSRWLHKKGGRYVVEGHSIDTDTLEPRIHYFNEDDIRVTWSRPYAEWSVDRFVRLP